MNRVLKIVVAWCVFGVMYEVSMVAYCFYRDHIGKPSDLPCVSFLWTSIGLLGSLLCWPLMALGDVINGNAIVMPTLIRGIGLAFLGGFAAIVAWVLRPRGSSRKPGIAGPEG